MKKSLLLTLAASAMLCASVFTGCSDLPEEYYPSAETKAAQAAAEKAAKKPAVPAGATAIVDFTTGSPTLSGSTATLANDTTFKDGKHVLSVEKNPWNVACVKLDKAVDLTGKTLYVLAKGETAEDSDGSNNGIALFIGDADAGSAASDSDWKDLTRSDADITLTDNSSFKEYEVPVASFGRFWQASAAADVSKVIYIGFRLKSANFEPLKVAAIYYK